MLLRYYVFVQRVSLSACFEWNVWKSFCTKGNFAAWRIYQMLFHKKFNLFGNWQRNTLADLNHFLCRGINTVPNFLCTRDSICMQVMYMVETVHAICEGLHTFDLVSFLLTLGIFCRISFCFYHWFQTGKYRLWRLSKIEDYVILILLVLLFRPSVFRVVLFSIFQFIGDTTPFHIMLLKQTYKRKKVIFKMAKSITKSNIFNG